jgi:hypothetical protein
LLLNLLLHLLLHLLLGLPNQPLLYLLSRDWIVRGGAYRLLLVLVGHLQVLE